MRAHRSRVAVAIPVLAVGIGLGLAAPGSTFPDPVGDVRGGPGPDVTSIVVSHTPTAVTFRVRFAKAPPLGVSVKGHWADVLMIGLDVPPRSLERSPLGWRGVDYVAGLHGTDRTAMLVKAQKPPSGRSKVLARPAVTIDGRTLALTVSRAALGNPAWVEIVVAAGRELSDRPTGGGSDEAPDRGAFHYRLVR